MEENSKKRSRKTKLVPREYLDSDDENIAVMQQEIEEEFANIKAQSLLKKLSSKSSQHKADLQFSVNVKIEKYDEELTDEEIYSSYIGLVPENAEKETALDSMIENTETKSTSKNKEDCIAETTSTNKSKENFIAETTSTVKSKKGCIIKTKLTNKNKEDCLTKIIATNKNKEDGIMETTATISTSDKVTENLPELLNKLEKDKHDEGTQGINIRIESVRSLSDGKTEVACYKITKNMIKSEFETFSKTTTSEADKLLEIHMRNYFGHYIPEVKLSKVEIKFQEVLNRWRTWVSCYPSLRDTPLMYICSSCERGWWHLHEFREHMAYHRLFVFDLYTEKHKSYIVIASTKKELKYCEIEMETNCWKCGKDATYHKDDYFECKGCQSYFETCTLLSMHEGYCEGNRKLYKKFNQSYVEFQCLVCPWKHWKEKDFFKHLLGVHSVRSDVPVFYTPMKCMKCRLMVNNFNVHKCILEPIKEPCEFCFKKFRSKLNLLVHNSASPNNYECRVCKKRLEKVCMEFEHLLEHTDNYKMLYMCLICKDSRCFLDLHSAKYHITDYHINNETANENYCQVVVPKSLLERIVPMKVMVLSAPAPEVIDETPKIQMMDSACQSGLEDLDINTVKNTSQRKDENVNVTEDFESNIQITIIDKDTVRKIMDSIPREEIPDVIINIKKENEDVNDNNETTSVSNNKNNVESNDVGNIINSVIVDVSHIKDEPMDIDESNGINETNEINETNDTGVTDGDNDINYNSTVNDIDVPIKLEIKEESDDSYEDDNMLVINENVSSSTTFLEKRPEKTLGKYYVEKYMGQIHNDTSRYRCTKCNSTYTSFRKYILHFVTHDYKPLTCPKCLKPMSTTQQLICHVNFHIKYNFVRVHSIGNDLSSKKKRFQCKTCQEMFAVREFFKHWESHLSIQAMGDVTSQFSVNMDGKPNLRDMLTILTDPEMIIPLWKEQPCVECNRTFERKNELKRHFIEHLLRDAYTERCRYGCLKCQVCGQEFSSSDHYKRHLRQHASLPLYKCDICDKAFSDSSNFSKHKKVHNLSVLVCNICKKKFQKKQCLIKHLEMHEVTEPIVCKTCDKTFYSQSLYSKHLKKNQARFKCQICETAYHTLRDKWDHMWQVHNERKYKADCPICEKSYRKYADVKKHIKEDHGNEYHDYYNKTGKRYTK